MAQTATTNCTHHWILGMPEDDIVRGKCKRCGLVREYPATVEGASRSGIYEEAASLGRSVALLPDGGSSGLPGAGRSW